VVDAIHSSDPAAIAEELGISAAPGGTPGPDRQRSPCPGHQPPSFDLATVANGIADKLIRRHPHVFDDVTVTSTEDVHRNWERVRAEEKGQAHESPAAFSPTSQV
jgi:XTP/dITP diphosphohydrolase